MPRPPALPPDLVPIRLQSEPVQECHWHAVAPATAAMPRVFGPAPSGQTPVPTDRRLPHPGILPAAASAWPDRHHPQAPSADGSTARRLGGLTIDALMLGRG